MRNDDCRAFLQDVLPHLGLRWPGYRKVHRTVCKRLRRRIRALGLCGLEAYRARLERDPAEWRELDAMCRIPISRFHRDRPVFEALAGLVLPALADGALREGRTRLRAWSCGCASGEEPYSLAILWRLRSVSSKSALRLEITASDSDPHVLGRAARACYEPGSLAEMPAWQREAALERRGELFCVRPAYREHVTFLQQDVREAMPEGPFDLILCRNLVFTYLERARQARILERLVARLHPAGCLVIGRDETLPGSAGLEAALPDLPIFRRSGAGPHGSGWHLGQK